MISWAKNPLMATTIFLVRNAATDFNRDQRLAGRRELGLSAVGRSQAAALAPSLGGLNLTEIVTSPLPRAVQTAELLASPTGLGVVRDPRLTDFALGPFEGRPHSEVASAPETQQFLRDPMAFPLPGGEHLAAVRDRLAAAVAQALADNELGAHILFVSHAGPLRILLAHYLGMDLGHYHRLRLSPATLSALRFDSEAAPPRLLALNCPVAPGNALY